MKKEVHPKYYPNATIKCACGAEFQAGSTMEEISVEICSQCHPYYTGKEKLLDTAGRVDKFKARMAAAEKHKKTENKKSEVKAEDKEKKQEQENKDNK